jgi:hypothetical protein
MLRKIRDKTLKDQKDEDEQTLINAGLSGASDEVVQRYGSANKEFLVGYSGMDNERGQVLAKSLKEESRRYYEQAEKIKKTVSDPKQEKKLLYKLLKSHGGFAAEVDEVALENSSRIINKDGTRRIRTDDLDQSKGGQRNHPLYDHVDLDKNGNPISGSASQMKIRGESAQEVHDKLMDPGRNGKNEKYLDHDVKIKVQKEFADDVRKIAKERIKELEQQEKILIGMQGKEKDLEKIRRQIFKEKQIIKNTEASNVTNQESKDIILKPKTITAKHIINYSHLAGVEQAKSGAATGGSISIIKNLVAVVKDEKDINDAVFEVVKDTGSAAALSYSTAFTGSALKGVMQNAKSTMTRALSKTNLPTMLVTVTLETGKTIAKYFNGEIDGVQCFEELGEKGTGMISSAMFAGLGSAGAISVFGKSFAIGQLIIPIPVIGGMIGGMLGYVLSSVCYGQLITALKEAKLARERRIQIEAECTEAIRMIREYRAEIETAISKYMSDYIITFHTAFDELKTALNIGDIDGFITGANRITRKLGGKPQFENMSEFESLMNSSDKFIL